MKNKCRGSDEIKAMLAQDAQGRSSKRAAKDKVDQKVQRKKEEY